MLENIIQLKTITSNLKTKIEQANSVFFETFQTKVKENPKELWKYIKRNKKDNVSIPALVKCDDMVTDAGDKAECFNTCFRSVFSLPVINNNTADDLALADVSLIEDIFFDALGIEVLLEGLSASKAAGPGCIPTALLKSCLRSMSPYLKLPFTKSLNYCSLPDDWKIASVVPTINLSFATVSQIFVPFPKRPFAVKFLNTSCTCLFPNTCIFILCLIRNGMAFERGCPASHN